MGWLTPILLSLLAGSSLSLSAEFCPVVTSLDSALLHLHLVSPGFFMKTTEDNTRVKRVELLRNDLAIKMGLASRLNGLNEDKLVELASMFAALKYETWVNRHGWSFVDIRAALMERAVSKHPSLEPFAWFMPTRDLVLAACDEEIYFTETMKNIAETAVVDVCDGAVPTSKFKSCQASTEYNHPTQFSCGDAFDGLKSTDWASAGEGVGAWIIAEYTESFLIKELKILQRAGAVATKEMNKAIEVEFDGLVKRTFTLTQIGNVNYNVLQVDPPVQSKTLRITVTEVYGHENNGFSEIVISDACKSEIVQIAETGGCAKDDWNLSNDEVTSLSQGTVPKGCLALCRDAGFVYSLDTASNWEIIPKNDWNPASCECSNSPDLVDSGSGWCPREVKMTGVGYPTVGFVASSPVFDPLTIDGVDITNNDLVGIKEVVYPGGAKEDSYFVAVHQFSIVLYKISLGADSRATGVTYIQHFRWDGDSLDATGVKDDSRTNWIYDWDQKDSGSRDPTLNPPTGTVASKLTLATSFALLPTFVSINDSMITTNEITVDNLDDPNNLAGLPVRGGKWQQNIVVFHSGSVLSVPGLVPVQVTTLAITSEGLHHLRTVSSFLDDGAFYLKSPPTKNVKCAVARTIGRKSYLITGSDNPELKKGALEIFKVTEEKKQLTVEAGYGQLVAESTFLLPSFNVFSVAIGGFLNSQVLVLSCDGQGTGSTLKVYKITNEDQLVFLSEMVFPGLIYSSVSYSRFQGKGVVLLSTLPNADQTITLLELSFKGELSELNSLIMEDATSLAEVLSHGSADEELLVLSNVLTGFKVLKGESLEDQPQMELDSLLDQDANAMRCYLKEVDGICILGTHEALFEIVTFKPVTLPRVDNQLAQATEWGVLETRIVEKLGDLATRFDDLTEETKKYLGSGEPVTAKWTFGDVNDVDILNLPGASATIKLTTVDSEGVEAAPVEFLPTLELDVSGVKSNLATWKTELDLVNANLLKAIDTSTTEDQTIDLVDVESVESAKIYFAGADLAVDELKFGSLKETLDSLLGNLYTKSANPAITGEKTFGNQISVLNLATGQVVEGAESVSPSSLLKKEGAQTIAKSHEFSAKASITDLELGTLTISDGSSASVLGEDLLIPASDLAGDFHFNNDVFAPAITTEIKDASMTLDQAEYDNILKKADGLSIEGTLKVTMLESADSLGRSINVKEGKVNDLSLKEINDNAVITHCVNCETRVDDITGTITFEGDVTMQQNLQAAKINTIVFSDYSLKEDFALNGFSDSGKKTFVNTVTASTLTADTYNNLNLDQIMTKKTSQTIAGKNTFNEKVTFQEINCNDEDGNVVDGSHPTLDGIDFLEKFQSDLYHMEANWVENDLLSAEIEFKNLVMGGASTIEFSDTVNAMDVPSVLSKIVQTTETDVKIPATKTFAKAVVLENVDSSKLIKSGTEYTTDNFANTVDTIELTGKKTFTKAVTFKNIFLYNKAEVNTIDFAKMLFCWIDLGVKNPDNVDISNHIHFKEVSTPVLNIARGVECFRCPSSQFPEVTLDSSNIKANVALFLGMAEGMLTDMTLEAGIQMMVQHRINHEPNDNLRAIGQVDGTSLEDLLQGLRQLVAAQYSLPTSSLDGKGAVELLRLTCRNPLLNQLDPEDDIALLNQPNKFCPGGSCIQSFKKGFTTKSLEVEDSITVSNTNPKTLVFGHHINTLDNERVSLSGDQTLKGDYTIVEARIGDGTESGTLAGKLIVEHDQVDIYSDQYKARYLDSACKAGGNAQTFTKARKVESISATKFIEGASGNIKVDSTVYDLPQLESDGYQLDDPEAFDSITFKAEVVLKADTTVGGTLDGVDVVALAEDIVLAGQTTVVSPSLSISGSDEAELTLAGKKTIGQAPSVRNVLSKNSGSTVHPRLMYRPCTRSSLYNEVVTGTVIETKEVPTVDNCHELCRSSACVASMYKTDTKMCTTFSSFTGFNELSTDKLGSVSFIYTCMFHLAFKHGTSDEKYLGVDSTGNTPLLKLKQEKEAWVDQFGILVHVSTGLAITGASGSVVDVDENMAVQKIKIVYNENTSIIKLENTAGDELTLTSGDLFSWTSTGTPFNAFTENGEVFDTVEAGSLVTRVLRKSGAQDLSGGVSVAGDLALSSGTVTSLNLGTLNVDEVATAYNYNSDQTKHVIRGSYELKSPLTVTTLTAQTLADRNFATFVADTVDKNSNQQEIVTGPKIFSSELVLNKDISVTGTTGGRNLDAAFADTVFVDTAATLAALNTFKADVVVDTGVADASVDPEIYKDLESQVQLSLSDSVIEYAGDNLDLTAVFDNTILKADVGPTTLAGEVVYKKDVSTADLTTGTLGLTSANDNVKIPADLVQITSADVLTTISDKTRKFSSINANKMVLNGQIYGKEAEDYLTVLYKDGAQTVTGSKGLTGDTSMTRDFVVGDRVIRGPGMNWRTSVGTVKWANTENVWVTWPKHVTKYGHGRLVFAPGYGPAVTVSGMVNGLKLASNLVFLAADGSLDNDVGFNTLSVKKMSLEGSWDTVNFDTMASNVFELGNTQTISEKWTIKSPVEFEKKIVQNGDPTDGEGTINDQKVIDLKSIDSIYVNVQAVKTSAQAEANTLCKYAKDLQESYLAGQAVGSYQDIARLSSDVAPRGSKIFKFGSKIKLAVVSSGNLEIYDINEATNDFTAATITREINQNQAGSDFLDGIALLNVFDLKPSSGTQVKISVKRAGGIASYRLTGDDQGLAASISAALVESVSFICQLDDKSFTLSREQDPEGYYSRISTKNLNGETVVVWEDSRRQQTAEVAAPKMDVVHAGESSDLVFVFTTPVDNLDGDMAMIVHIQPQVDANSVVTYTEMFHTMTDVKGPDFVLLNIDWKLLLYSAGEFGMKVADINLETQEVNDAVPDIDGSFSNLQIHPSLIGEPSTVLAVKDDSTVVFVDYKGTDGFKVYTLPLAWSTHLQSVSVLTYLENDVSKYVMSLAGEKNLAVLEGNLVYPVSKEEITCPEPEFTTLVTSFTG